MGGSILKLFNIKSAVLAVITFVFIFFTTTSGTGETQKFKSSFLKKPKVLRVEMGVNHYWVMLPDSFKPEKKYPIVIYLHCRKYDAPSVDRAKLHLDYKWLKNIEALNYIVALPTLPLASYPTWTMKDNPFIESVIQDVRRRFHQKETPLFLAGFSAGALHSMYTGLNGMFDIDGIAAFAYGLIDHRSVYAQADRNVPIFLAVGKFDISVKLNVLFSYNRLKSLKFTDVIYKEYPIGHWVHDDFIKDLNIWVNTKAAKIQENRDIAIHSLTENRQNFN